MPDMVEVDARCANADSFPFGVDECRQLVGQRARVTGPNLDRSRTFGFVTVRSAALVGDEIALVLALESPYSGVFTSTDGGPARVAIGYERRASGDIVLREVAPDTRPAVPAPITPPLTDEERYKGADMLRQCAYETTVHVPCRRAATAMIRVGPDAWHYRCRSHENFGGMQPVQIRPIPLVPHPSDIKEPNAWWITRTAWWRLAGPRNVDRQAVDFAGRDLFDVLVEVAGLPETVKMWEEACTTTGDKARLAMIHEPEPEPEPLSGVIASKPAPLTSIVQSEEECLGHGGHCFERVDVAMASDPPQYPEKCKHCPATRVAIERSPFYYRYPDGSIDASTRG